MTFAHFLGSIKHRKCTISGMNIAKHETVFKYFSISNKSTVSRNDATAESSMEGHVYILKGLALEVRLTFTSFGDGRAETCSAEMCPCDVSIFLSKQQLRQRRMLEYTMLAQRRLDFYS